jgi:hypothetical protein
MSRIKTTPNWIDYAQSFQVWHLQEEATRSNALLGDILDKLNQKEAFEQKEVFISNLAFASEQIFEDLKQLPLEKETAKLVWDFEELFAVDLGRAQRQTTSIQLKRDMAALAKAFSDFMSFAKESQYRDLKIQNEKIQAAASDLDHLYDRMVSVRNRQYRRPAFIRFMNYGIWAVGLYFWNFKIILYYYAAALLYPLIGKLLVRSRKKSDLKNLDWQANGKARVIKDIENQMALKKVYYDKFKKYTGILEKYLG